MEGAKKMQEKIMELDSLSFTFEIIEDNWQLHLRKSQTNVDDIRQTRLITEAPEDTFVPVEVLDEGDMFVFNFTVNQHYKHWEDLRTLHRNDALRLLCNVSQLKKYLNTRFTFLLHPNNLVFNDNLMPHIVYRGIRDLLPPFDMSEDHFFKQLQCLSIALFSKKYSFEQLYNGALIDARETEFERQIGDMEHLDDLIRFLEDSYQQEQQKAEKEMQVVPIKKFRLYKQLSIIMIILSVLIAAPLIYVGFFKLPYNQQLLDAHEEYIKEDNSGVVSMLEDENAEKLPKASKYILAHSYINIEQLSDTDKASIMKNVSLKSDDNYLLYWIYNGRGMLDEALDTAKYLDDPQLIMYGLIQKIEATKNNPELSGEERDDTLESLKEELKNYREEYNLDEADEEESESSDELETDQEHDEATDEKDKKNKKDKKDKED